MYKLGNPNIRLSFYISSFTLLLIVSYVIHQQGMLELDDRISQFGHFFLIGLVAATVANSTGAGGGIVFIPAFLALGLSPLESLATSFAIQCFGMTSGALAWLNLGQQEQKTYPSQWQSFHLVLLISSVATLKGLWIVQWGQFSPPVSIHLLFAVFSLFVGIMILIRTFILKQTGDGRSQPIKVSELGLIYIASFISGMITAWISIGIGEVLAVLLLLMRFRVHLAIAAAVCISSITVLSAVPFHIIKSQAIHLDILMFAAPAAIIGGAIAKILAVKLGAKTLKSFMAIWIIISAIVYLL